MFMFLELRSGHRKALNPAQTKKMQGIMSGALKPTPADVKFLSQVKQIRTFDKRSDRHTTIESTEFWWTKL